jgi:hypothetical protein
MKANLLPKDAYALLAYAESIATVLSENHDDFGISTDLEALLRASIGAATFAIDRYLAIAAGGKKSPVARKHLAEARRRCYRSVEQLSRRVTRCVAHVCRFTEEKDLFDRSRFVCA